MLGGDKGGWRKKTNGKRDKTGKEEQKVDKNTENITVK